MDVEVLAQEVKEELLKEGLIQVETSMRHVHLSQKDVDQLFGEGYMLHSKRELSQTGQYLCEERVTLIGPKGQFEKVAILGPVRGITQVEISRTDAFGLGIWAPLRESGDLSQTPGIKIQAAHKEITLNQGVIVAKRHIHMTPHDAEVLQLKDKACVNVEILTQRPLMLRDVVVRVDESFRLRMHVDSDEANAAEVKGFVLGKIIK